MVGKVALTVAVLAAAAVTVGAAPAAAEPQSGYPYGCYVGALAYGYTQGAFSRCDGGRGQHRVKITCERAATPWIQDILYGAWVNSVTDSTRYCLNAHDVRLTSSYQVRTG